VNWFGSVIPIQASCGICDYSSNSNITEILHKADDALYLSKKNHQKFNNAQELTTSITNKKRDKSANTPESTTYH
jgi:GGDEF domain-containing protein